MIYVLLANGFEEIEALTPIDLLRRAGKSVTTVAIGGERSVRGSHGITVTADALIEDIDGAEIAELTVLPGGMPGSANIAASEAALELIRATAANGGRLAAICAAPMVLGELGLLRGKRAVCFPGFEKHLKDAVISKEKVVTDGLVTTAKGAGASMSFALELVSLLCGSDVSEKIKNGIFA